MPVIITVVIVACIAIAIYLFLKRSAEQRAAHDARLRAMAQVTLAAVKKKHAAEAAAKAKAAQAEASTAPSTAPSAAPSTAPAREERDCPFCAEPILKKARVCKHCGRDVEPTA